MSNRRFKKRRPQLTPEGRKGVDAYTAEELHRFLVEDAVKSHATFLPWAVAAYERIGRLRQTSADEAYQEVRQEVHVLRGRPGMPL